MAKSTNELRGVIRGWTSISSAWNDTKSRYVENNYISKLEYALQDLEEQMEDIILVGMQTENKIDEIERNGEAYEW